MNLKNGNANAKHKLVKQTLIDDIEIYKYSYIKHAIHLKFKKEGFVVKDDIIQMFIDELPVLIEIMSKLNTDKNYDDLLDYVELL